MKIRFNKKCGVQGVTYEDGDTVDTADLPQDCLHSLKLMGVYEVVPDDPAPEGEQSGETPEGDSPAQESPVDSNKTPTKGKK